MQKTQGRKYQVVEEAEIDLVLKCRDSHEFYEQYLKVFPDTKKGLDSISKIWKRRSEFAKKRQLVLPHGETVATPFNTELDARLAEQTKILAEIAATTKENLDVNRQILAALTHQNRLLGGHEEKQKEPPVQSGQQSQKPPVQKKVPEKQTPIMVGS